MHLTVYLNCSQRDNENTVKRLAYSNIDIAFCRELDLVWHDRFFQHCIEYSLTETLYMGNFPKIPQIAPLFYNFLYTIEII